MAFDRWIALALLVISLVYGYTAFFTMDDQLAPIMKRAAVWPSSFPKVLSIGAMLLALSIVLGLEKHTGKDPDAADINLSRLSDYKFGQAFLLLGLMVAYALMLRPIGFLASTFLFLFVGSYLLGERRYVLMAIVSAIAAGSVWYLVDAVLGIFLRPFPMFLVGG
jgi:putative tricarboxylic transport membrane protein